MVIQEVGKPREWGAGREISGRNARLQSNVGLVVVIRTFRAQRFTSRIEISINYNYPVDDKTEYTIGNGTTFSPLCNER